MSSSGNGEDWSEWVNYSQSYNKHNIASGLNGTTMESGYKTVYVRFKDKTEVFSRLIFRILFAVILNMNYNHFFP